jgi:hypothetical protein
MQRYPVYLYLETAVNVSCGTSNHHQERIQLYLQHLVFVTPLKFKLLTNKNHLGFKRLNNTLLIIIKMITPWSYMYYFVHLVPI